jgi:pimeloyl-ACP methyl ester carboxylesterase
MAMFQSGAIALAYDDLGPRDGRPVLLLHGFASNRGEMWRRLGWYGAFERKGHRIVALDWRGHGESEKPHAPDAYAREALVGDAIALLDHLEIGRADVVGYSMGARLALTLALAHPERVDHLVLGGVGGKLFEPAREPGIMAAAMTAKDPESIAEPMLRSFRHFADEQGEDRLALAAFSQASGDSLSPEALGGMRLPVLVVAGARDALAGDPEELAAAIPGARAVTLPRCDHFSAIPHALFKASVFDFLDDTMDL